MILFTQQSGPGKKASRDGSKRSQAGNPKVLDVKLEKVELHQAENAWKPNPLKEITNGDAVGHLSFFAVLLSPEQRLSL